MALLPPPGEAGDIGLALVRTAGAQRIHLSIDRARVGDLETEIRFADRSGGLSAAATSVSIETTPLGPGGRDAAATATPVDGAFVARFAAFDDPGWWRLTVAAEVGGETVEVPFELLVPDPNQTGVDPPESEPSAERLFVATLERMEALRSVRQHDVLADGAGGLIVSTAEYAAPDRFRLTTEEGDELIAVGAAQVFRRPDESWRETRRSSPFHFPTYRANYEGAIGQRIGREETLQTSQPGSFPVPARVLSFYVPRDRARYCWWIARDDGLVHREVMIAPSHYMTSRLEAFNEASAIPMP